MTESPCSVPFRWYYSYHKAGLEQYGKYHLDDKMSALTGRQMRAARALLGWSAQDLADRSKVGISTIRRTELVDGSVRMIAGNVGAVLRAFDAAGVVFIAENGGGDGVRMKIRQP